VDNDGGGVSEAGAQLATCYRHPGRETGVLCTRCERPICPECMTPASVGFQCPECVSEGRRSIRPTKTMYGGRARERADVTLTLIAINVVVFVLTAASGAGVASGNGRSNVYDNFALVPVQVVQGDWWRLVSSTFLHYGILHIGFNMWALYVIGVPLEGMLGRLRFVTLYLLSGLGGSLLSFALGPVNEVAAGASGAIFGIFGAFFVILRRRNLETGGILGLIVVNLVLTFAFPNIDWRGHVGGLAVGVAVGAVFAYAPAGAARDRLQAAGCAVVAVVLAATGVVGAAQVRHACKTTQNPFTATDCLRAGLPTE
jgi:membrane associated rhomboid family serine protease